MSERSEAMNQYAVRDAVPDYHRAAPADEATDDVPPGYKRSEMGIISCDWNILRLGDIAQFKKGCGLTKSEMDSDGVHQCIHYGELFTLYGEVISEVASRTNCFQKNQARSRENDVLMPTSDVTPNGLATASCLNKDDVLLGGDILVIRTDRNVLLGEFLSYAVKVYRHTIMQLVSGTTVYHLYPRDMAQFQLPVPIVSEQRAIATALSDADALIESLDRLVAKKRAIKQATMQQLLTGQTRLPGFSGEWEMKRLGDHLAFLRTGTNSRAELRHGDGIGYLHYGDIHTTPSSHLDCAVITMPRIPVSKVQRLDRLQIGDVVFVDASEDLEGVGKSVEITGLPANGLVAGLHTIAARFDKSVLADGFKGHLQFHPAFQKTLRSLAAGTKVLATNRCHIADVEIDLPAVEEQTAIADVLSDMSAEIEGLECRRDKARQIKQAMMQELLTGRTRLAEPVNRDLPEDKPHSGGRKANVYFMRSVLAAEIVDQLHIEPTFGHVKFEKVLFLVEHLCDVDTGSTYYRKAAGPYDNRALRSIDSQLRRQQWFDARKEKGRYRYVPLQKQGGHKSYFERYFSGISSRFEEIVDIFRGLDTERCEIVATLFSAWNDLLRNHPRVSDEMIVHEVLNNWHESKKRIPEDRWLNALVWMREKGFVPKGETFS